MHILNDDKSKSKFITYITMCCKEISLFEEDHIA